MTELEMLRRRRELVVLSADVQRATVVCRLDRIETGPLRVLAVVATNAARVVAKRRIAFALVALASRMFGRRRGAQRA
ncbi:MAG TPA: hypothetical protein VKR38_09330 [Usitatibacter sp.]|nr:hypothetical protein [Usitatibacter sp.]